MGLGHPVVTVTAGCASILDQNWRIKNSHLIDGKLVFRLETSLSSGGTSVPLPAKQSRFQMDDYGDLHEQILHTEAHIEDGMSASPESGQLSRHPDKLALCHKRP
jgi:hypothetical protein